MFGRTNVLIAALCLSPATDTQGVGVDKETERKNPDHENWRLAAKSLNPAFAKGGRAAPPTIQTARKTRADVSELYYSFAARLQKDLNGLDPSSQINKVCEAMTPEEVREYFSSRAEAAIEAIAQIPVLNQSRFTAPVGDAAFKGDTLAARYVDVDASTGTTRKGDAEGLMHLAINNL